MIGMLVILATLAAASGGVDIGLQIALAWPNFIFNVNGIWVAAFLIFFLVWHALTGRIGRGGGGH